MLLLILFSKKNGKIQYLSWICCQLNKTEILLVKTEKENGHRMRSWRPLLQEVNTKLRRAKIQLRVFWNWDSEMVQG